MARKVSVRKHLRREPEPHYLARPIAMAPDVQRTKKPLGGISSAAQVKLLRDSQELGLAVFKPGNDNAFREADVSTLDDLLGWDVVPKTIITMQTTQYSNGEKVIGSLQEWKPAVMFESFAVDPDGRIAKNYDHTDAMKIALLDLITGNTDRHGGNILVEPDTGKLWAIDNAWSFGGGGGGPQGMFHNSVLLEPQVYYEGPPGKEERQKRPALIPPGTKIPVKLRRDLQGLSEANFRAALAGIDIGDVNVAWQRKQLLVKRGRIPTKAEQSDFAYGYEK